MKELQIVRKPSKPWRNPDGSKKTDAEISLLGKRWYLETWKDFLDEDVGRVRNRKRRRPSRLRKKCHLKLIHGKK